MNVFVKYAVIPLGGIIVSTLLAFGVMRLIQYYMVKQLKKEGSST